MRLLPITIKSAKEYVARLHRHHKPPAGGLFAFGAESGGALVGVLIAGRPVSRILDDGLTAEVTRCCTDGEKNACSFLYGAAWRAARCLGYRRMVTYTMPSEGGGSLRGAGWTPVASVPGHPWSRQSRPRRDQGSTVADKVRWQVATADYEDVSRCGVLTRLKAATPGVTTQIELL